MKNKLRDINQETQLLALDFLDYSMDDGKMPLWTQVSSKDFLSSLVNLLKTRDAPEVNERILFLIEKWGKKFEKYKTIIPGFSDIYNHLKDSGIQFPIGKTSTYSKYIMSDEDLNNYNNSTNNYNYSNYNNEYKIDDYGNDTNISKSKQSNGNDYVESINLDLRTSSYENKYRKLVNKLDLWTKNIGIANELIDNARGGTYDSKLIPVIDELKTGNRLLIETIQGEKLKNEKLMEISLGVADDINRTLERFKILKKKGKPDPFLSSFIEKRALTGGNDYSYSKPPSKSKSNYPQKQVNLLESFDNPQIPINNPPQQTQQSNTVNDLLDIFSNPSPIETNINNGPYPSFAGNNMNTNSNMGGFNMNMNANQGFGGNNNFNIPNLTQSQQQPVDLLSQQLKGAYNTSPSQNINYNNMMNFGTNILTSNTNNLMMGNIGSNNSNPSLMMGTTNTNNNMGNSLMDLNFSMPSQPPQNPNFSKSVNIQPSQPPIQNMNMNFNNIQNNNSNLNFMSQPQQPKAQLDLGMGMNTNNNMNMNPNLGMNMNLNQNFNNNINSNINQTNNYNMNYNTQQTTNPIPLNLSSSTQQNQQIDFNFGMTNNNTNLNMNTNLNTNMNMNNNMNTMGNQNNANVNILDSLF